MTRAAGIAGGFVVAFVVAAPVGGVGWPGSAEAQQITEFTTGKNTAPFAITAGPDGALWFADASYLSGWIGRITTAGAITKFPVPTSSALTGITVGPDGALWFTEYQGNKIGRITTTGQVTEYAIPTSNSVPIGIAKGPDGDLWFTEFIADKIGRVIPDGTGTITEFPLGYGSRPRDITAGPDGALWFVEFLGNKIGRITTDGTITEFPVPTGNPYNITVGPDGALWFTEQTGNKIGRIDATTKQITEYDIPTSNSSPEGIAAGPDGALWFTEQTGNKIGRITTTGQVTEFAIGKGGGGKKNTNNQPQPTGITQGPDGNLWFAEWGDSKIGRLVPPPLGPGVAGQANCVDQNIAFIAQQDGGGSIDAAAAALGFASVADLQAAVTSFCTN